MAESSTAVGLVRITGGEIGSDRRIARYPSPPLRFKDGFDQVQGIESYLARKSHLNPLPGSRWPAGEIFRLAVRPLGFATLDEPGFQVRQQVLAGRTGYLHCRYGFRLSDRAEPRRIDRRSRIRFDSQGRAPSRDRDRLGSRS